MVKGFVTKLLPLVFIVAGVVSAQTKQPQRQDNPTVKETLRWMQTTLESGSGDHEVYHEIRSVRLEDFVGCKVHFSYSDNQVPYANGEPAPEPNKTYHVDYFFELGDIDPTSIDFSKGLGLRADDKGLFELPSRITIRTRNDEKKITTRLPWQSKADSKPDDTYVMFELDSMDSDYVVRFATAFKHAVEACGGKPSLFADSARPDERTHTAPGGVAVQSAPPRKDIPAIARSANGAIVSILMSDKNGKPIAQGTGFLVAENGRILTNYHVVAEGSSAIVKFPDGTLYTVDGMLDFNKARDVAIIKIHGRVFRALLLGDSNQIQVGEDVVAIGNPLSLESTVSNGIVSGIRVLEKEGGKYFQITAPISPGSSGGPLFNMAGDVIGITTSYIGGGENLNFAIPINDVMGLLRFESTQLQALPNETEPPKVQTHDGDAPPSAPVAAPRAASIAREYYQQLYEAGGFSKGLPNAVCFSDDTDSDKFFTFVAYAYDENYYNAQAKVQALHPVPTDPDIVTPEMDEQFKIMEAVQRSAPYVTFLMKGWLETFSPEAQKFFRGGGRILTMTLYEKGVKSGSAEWRWDGSAWALPLKTEHPNAKTQVSTIYHLSIEPTTMRYVRSGAVTITVGSGSTAANETDHYGPWGGVCQKVPNPK